MPPLEYSVPNQSKTWPWNAIVPSQEKWERTQNLSYSFIHTIQSGAEAPFFQPSSEVFFMQRKLLCLSFYHFYLKQLSILRYRIRHSFSFSEEGDRVTHLGVRFFFLEFPLWNSAVPDGWNKAQDYLGWAMSRSWTMGQRTKASKIWVGGSTMYQCHLDLEHWEQSISFFLYNAPLATSTECGRPRNYYGEGEVEVILSVLRTNKLDVPAWMRPWTTIFHPQLPVMWLSASVSRSNPRGGLGLTSPVSEQGRKQGHFLFSKTWLFQSQVRTRAFLRTQIVVQNPHPNRWKKILFSNWLI